MRRKSLMFLIFSLLVVLVFFGLGMASVGVPKGEERVKVMEIFRKMPLYFIKNEGQIDNKVKYYAREGGKWVYFTEDGVYVALGEFKGECFKDREFKRGFSKKIKKGECKVSYEIMKMRFMGGVRSPLVIGENRLSGKVNYYLGNDPKRWREDVPTYSGVRYKGLYEGVDVVFYGNERELEYDVVVREGGNPRVFKVAFEGVKEVRVNKEGDLVVVMPSGKELVQRKPKVYQEIAGKRVELEGRYVVRVERGEKVVSFEVPEYNPKYALVIDPVIEWSTYLGGSNVDFVNDIKVDSMGNIYVAGCTLSYDFPTPQGNLNRIGGFVSRFTSTGNLVSTIYIGFGCVSKIALDSSNSIYLIGNTEDENFPIKNAFQSRYAGEGDGFLMKVNASGQIIFSTFIGGNNEEEVKDVEVDSQGNVYVVGTTQSSNFPIYNPPFSNTLKGNADGFIAKFKPNGEIIFSSYFGGSDWDVLNGVTVDNSNNIWLAGYTHSFDLPITANAFQSKKNGIQAFSDAFVVKISQNGQILYSTYLGGEYDDEALGITSDRFGNVIIVGYTASSNFPRYNSQFGPKGRADVFIVKFNSEGNLVFSMCLAGSDDEEPNSVATDNNGNIVVVGYTHSPDFPVVKPIKSILNDFLDSFITKLDPLGNLIFSTFLGGSNWDVATGVATDQERNIFLAGYTLSSDFPLINPYQRYYKGYYDAFLVKISTSGDSPSTNYYTLTITLSGTGTGNITAQGCTLTWNGNIATCQAPAGTKITLIAQPGSNCTFSGWSGACSGNGTCTITLNSNLNLTATFNKSSGGSGYSGDKVYGLVVEKFGSGSGTVQASGCNFIWDGGAGMCTAPAGTKVTLIAKPDSQSTFAGWGGACSGTGPCTVILNSNVYVSVTFNKGAVSNFYTLTVTKSGSGSGEVKAQGCTLTWDGNVGTCQAKAGAKITLTATPDANSTFAGWGGACSGNKGCTITLNADTSVTANFNRLYILKVTPSGNGTGTVTAKGCNLTWKGNSGTCKVPAGTQITLTAKASANSVFAGWDGACSGSGPCTLTLNDNAEVVALFNKVYTLTVTKSGSGVGMVEASGCQLSWRGSAGTCQAQAGTQITLTASPDANSVFAGWRGDCSGNGPCTITLNSNSKVTANFTKVSILTVTKVGAGNVTAVGCNLTWEGDTGTCIVPVGTKITLTASPDENSTFAGWSGACAGTKTCSLTMNSNQKVTATFTKLVVMKIYSPTIPDKGRIPLKYVMKEIGGENLSPPIKWEGIPEGTKSLVLLCVDIHPVARNWIHWIVINIPPEVEGFEEGASLRSINSPAHELTNSYGFRGWGGPQPPSGTGDHPYVFKLFALKVPEIKLSERPSYEEILKAVKPYLLQEAEFTGYFGR